MVSFNKNGEMTGYGFNISSLDTAINGA